MKMNKKGMTLVECIIAMAVFAVATTGFTMAASACVKAQIKYHSRNRAMNNQTTNLEHFSAYSGGNVNSTNLTPMDPDVGYGSNMYQVEFTFEDGTTITNRKVNGYRAGKAEGEDGVFELSFLAPIAQVPLNTNECWLTIYNCSEEGIVFDMTLPQGFEFFDSSKEKIGSPYRLMLTDSGDFKRIGIRKSKTEASVPPGAAIDDVTVHMEDFDGKYTTDIKVQDYVDPYGDGDKYGYLYFEESSFKTTAQYFD